MKKRILAFTLALALLLPVFAVGSFALTPQEELQAQGKALLDQTSAILSSRKFTLKASGASPVGSKLAPLVFVSDGSRSVIETTMDWVQLLRATDGTSIKNTFSGWLLQLFFGKKIRIVSSADQDLIIFPNRRFYINIPGAFGNMDIFTDLFKPIAAPEVIAAEKTTDGGKEYLRVSITGEEGLLMHYYYLGDALKRIEIEAKNPEAGKQEVVSFPINSLSAAVDECYFSTKWMFRLPLGKLFPSSAFENNLNVII